MASNSYQDAYPSAPVLDSTRLASPAAAELLTLEFFEAPPGRMPTRVFEQHHLLLNLNPTPHRLENWRDGQHRDFVFRQNDIIVTPAGIESGWRWHSPSRVIVVTLLPERFERFAQQEVGVLLPPTQLKSIPQFEDRDICQAGAMLLEALKNDDHGADLMFESLARVFLVKLIQRYALTEQAYAFSKSFTSTHYARVLAHVEANYSGQILVEDLAEIATLSPSHFAQLFKKVMGVSPMQFVTAYRVSRAKHKMQDYELPLLDIAMACGFSDQSHFSRVFKQSEGVSPSQYRASLR